MTEQHTLWTERYRPKKIKDCVLTDIVRNQVRGFIESGDMPNLLLSGPAGTGKTTLAKALCDEMGYEWMMINGSDEGKLIDTLRNKIKNFAASVSFTESRKVVIIDEADYIPPETQAALRSFIEQYSSNCGFVFTCNFPNRLMEAIHSRCTSIDFSIPHSEQKEITKQIYKRTAKILKDEGIEFDKNTLAVLVTKFFPDFRRLINELQRYSAAGTIDAEVLALVKSNISELIKFMRQKDFKEVRTWVAKSPSLDMAPLSRALFDQMYDYLEPGETMAELVLILADYQYKHNFVADKEINIVAMLTQIMISCNFK
jgi:DNA polymerase III delta prime subunit